MPSSLAAVAFRVLSNIRVGVEASVPVPRTGTMPRGSSVPLTNAGAQWVDLSRQVRNLDQRSAAIRFLPVYSVFRTQLY